MYRVEVDQRVLLIRSVGYRVALEHIPGMVTSF